MISYSDPLEGLAGEFDRCSADASEIVVSSVLIERGFCTACLIFVHCGIWVKVRVSKCERNFKVQGCSPQPEPRDTM